MEYVINNAFGGFYIPEDARRAMKHYDAWDTSDDIRTHPILIEWVKTHQDETDLAIVIIPEEATDWELAEYDGLEEIIAVVDGKMIHLDVEEYGEEEE